MRIQVIQYSNSSAREKDGIFFSPMREPRALDDFDINIIDLSVSAMWKYDGTTYIGQINSFHDLETIRKMVENKKNAIVVYVMPQNINYFYNSRYSQNRSMPIKDTISGVLEFSINKAIPAGTHRTSLAFEKTKTAIGGFLLEADFYLIDPTTIITESERSKKPTTISIAENVYVTTLAIMMSNETLKRYIDALFGKQKREATPEWMNDISFGDDALQESKIEQGKIEIELAKIKIEAAVTKLKENAKYKSILYTNGDERVEVVFDILEKILACDLSGFVDNKKEDFLIKLPSCTFIGEIKGVTSNVKYEHISQVELHYRGYLDRLAESGVSESVKQLLIMNPFRTKALDKRDPVHISQIDLAIRNGCLIIETNILLRLYEKFCNGEVTSQKCIDVLSSRTGLLCLADFDDTGDN